jgi:hypothetical protein
VTKKVVGVFVRFFVRRFSNADLYAGDGGTVAAELSEMYPQA